LGARVSAAEPAAETRAPKAGPDVASADAAFRAKRYDEAGRIYAALAEAGKLPEARKDAWAYCRWHAVVERINAPPKDQAEWAEIHAEIEKIRRLSPKNWFGEYLRNLAADMSAGSRKAKARPGQVILRGAAPDEPAAPARTAQPPSAAPRPKDDAAPKTRPSRPAPPPAIEELPDFGPPPTSAPAPSATPEQPGKVGRPAGSFGNWRIWESPNFRILHADDALAERAAKVAEAAREEQTRRWAGSSPAGPWTPRCDLYLYPTPEVYHQATGQPADSPGFSTMGLNAGRVVGRRINLRADHPALLTAVLPHEVTHVVLADLFADQPIPKWADEGMAVLSEPLAEQQRRATDLTRPLASGRLFRVADLMGMEYPDGQHWPLFYAQSVSLTRFLVERGTPAQFIRFVQASQRNGLEAELKRTYQIDGFADLQKRWLAFARSAPTAATASSGTPARAAR
jgi:hypothetical protein